MEISPYLAKDIIEVAEPMRSEYGERSGRVVLNQMIMGMGKLTEADYDYLGRFLKDHSGLVLGLDRIGLLENRLVPVMSRFGFCSLSDVVQCLRGGRDYSLSQAVVEAMTVNETSFFRDRAPFFHLKNMMLPELIAHRTDHRQLRIWSAAAATGQEAYSVAMTLLDLSSALINWKVDIIATDLSSEVLERARAGLYSQFEVQRGLPIQQLIKHFSKRDALWQISPRLRAMPLFQQFNLLEDMAPLGQFDVILCRNVLGYFDGPTSSDVTDRLAEQLASDGVLYVGETETVSGPVWVPVPGTRGIYRKAPPSET